MPIHKSFHSLLLKNSKAFVYSAYQIHIDCTIEQCLISIHDTYTAKAAAVTKGINDQLSASQTSLNTAKAGLEKIASGLNDGAKQLADGASAIPSDIPSEPVQALSDGLAQVYAGATKVDTGTGPMYLVS